MCPPNLIHSASLALAAALLLGCSSTGGGGAEEPNPDASSVEWIGPEGREAYDPEAIKDRRKAGLLLAELDKSMRAWNNIVLDGKASQDLTRLDLLESTLRHETKTNHALLVDQLQSGPPINRQIAAAALGFSDNPKSLAPLLGALQDSNDDVVANALLGLSTLRSPKTQVGSIASLFTDKSRPINIRSNAGRTLRSLPLGSLDEESRQRVIEAARLALGDDEASVRVHGCLLLAEVVDTEAIQRLSVLLMDQATLVARAASRSIARIGSIDTKFKGQAARALTAHIDEVDRDNVRSALLDDLQRMAQVNYGDDTEAWLKYAHKLP